MCIIILGVIEKKKMEVNFQGFGGIF